MTTFTVTEKVTGQYPKRFDGIDLRATLISILLSPIGLLSMFNKGNSDVSDSKWEHLFVDDSFKIEKRIIAKAGFDDCIPFYNLASSDKKLNEIIRLKYFADFIIKTN